LFSNLFSLTFVSHAFIGSIDQDFFNPNRIPQLDVLDTLPQVSLSNETLEQELTENQTEILNSALDANYNFFSLPEVDLHEKTGFPYDNITIDEQGTIDRIPYTSITNIGLAFVGISSAYKSGLISYDDAIQRIEKMLDSMDKLEYYSPKEGDYKGKKYLFNYYDLETLISRDKFISSVDTAWLLAGLITAKQAFPELKQKINKWLNDIDLGFFYDKRKNLFATGYNYDANRDRWTRTRYFYNILNSETRIISYVAVGKGDIEGKEVEQHWKALRRSKREYDGISVVRSYGGSAFEHGMPNLFVDETGLSKYGLGLNTKKAFIIQMLQAAKNEYPIWGESPSTDGNYGYGVFGTPSGEHPYPSEGIITPHASFLGLSVTPKQAGKNIEAMKIIYPNSFDKRVGFVDAIDVKNDNVIRKALSLDQGMSLLSLQNYLNNGVVKELFMSSPEGQRIKELVQNEVFFSDKDLQREVNKVYNKAKNYLKDEKWRESEILFNYIKELSQDYQLKVPSDLEELIQETLSLKDTKLEEMYNQGVAQIEKKQYQEAIKTFSLILGEEPHYKDAKEKLYQARQLLSEEAPVLPYDSITDFETGLSSTLYMSQIGTFDNDPSAPGDCTMELIKNYDREHGNVLRLKYYVPQGTFNGLYVKLKNLKAEKGAYIAFDVKGDSSYGYPDEFQIELKQIGAKYPFPNYVVKNISGNWKEVKIPITAFSPSIPIGKALAEFTIVFQDWRQGYGAKGAILIDNLRYVPPQE
jgi:hypothetical protein